MAMPGRSPSNATAKRSWAPVNRVFAEGCAALGIRHAPDLNGLDADADVFGPMPHNRFKEVRQGTLPTYCGRRADGPISRSAAMPWSIGS